MPASRVSQRSPARESSRPSLPTLFAGPPVNVPPQLTYYDDKFRWAVTFRNVDPETFSPEVYLSYPTDKEKQGRVFCRLCEKVLNNTTKTVSRHKESDEHVQRVAQVLNIDFESLRPMRLPCEWCGKGISGQRVDSLARHRANCERNPDLQPQMQNRGQRSASSIQRSASLGAVQTDSCTAASKTRRVRSSSPRAPIHPSSRPSPYPSRSAPPSSPSFSSSSGAPSPLPLTNGFPAPHQPSYGECFQTYDVAQSQLFADPCTYPNGAPGQYLLSDDDMDLLFDQPCHSSPLVMDQYGYEAALSAFSQLQYPNSVDPMEASFHGGHCQPMEFIGGNEMNLSPFRHQSEYLGWSV